MQERKPHQLGSYFLFLQEQIKDIMIIIMLVVGQLTDVRGACAAGSGGRWRILHRCPVANVASRHGRGLDSNMKFVCVAGSLAKYKEPGIHTASTKASRDYYHRRRTCRSRMEQVQVQEAGAETDEEA
jgi:hypothetical protein